MRVEWLIPTYYCWGLGMAMTTVMVRDDGYRIVDWLWERIELLLPSRPSHPLGCHRARVSDRAAMDAIFFVLRTGCQWNALSATGMCSSSSAHRRFQEWTRAGVFEQLWQEGLLAYDERRGVVAQRGGYGHGEGAFEQTDTGPNPTDRAKKGPKRSLLVDGRGVPTAVVIAAANVPDFLLLGETLDAQQLTPPADPQASARVVCLDRGYRQCAVIEICDALGVIPIIEARHEEATRLATDPAQRAKRWVVERTFSWLNRFRRLLIRWEKKSQNYLAFLHLACAIITYRHVPLPR